MNQLIIIFEFKEQDSNRTIELKNRIRKYKSFAFLTNNSCAIWTDKTASNVRDYLKSGLRSGDKLFVSSISAPAAWLTSISQEVTDYIHKNLK
jgi:hypothetical protein